MFGDIFGCHTGDGLLLACGEQKARMPLNTYNDQSGKCPGPTTPNIDLSSQNVSSAEAEKACLTETDSNGRNSRWLEFHY